LYDPKEFEELSPTEIEEKMKPYYEEQYANIELKYQEKEIKTIEHDLTDVPDIETSP
jgi:hypothetical protein